MHLKIDDEQRKLLLETLAKAHLVEYMQGKDNSQLEKLIGEIMRVLQQEGKKSIFDNVYMQVRQYNC